LPGKEKTAAKGDTLTVVFLLIASFQSISPSSLDTEVNRWAALLPSQQIVVVWNSSVAGYAAG
jgi:hypothetical protein